MAIPPSAGNPINVGPYKRIVGFHWPDTPPPVPVKYIWTRAFVKCFGYPTSYGSDVPWDGVVGAVPGSSPDWQNYSPGGAIWQISPGRPEFFDNCAIFDADGTMLTAETTASSLGVSISKPTIPQTVIFTPWQYAQTVSKPFGPVIMTGPVTNPVSTFYASAGVCYQLALQFYPDPPIQYYYAYYDYDTGLNYMRQWGRVNLTDYVEGVPCDLTSVSATYDGLIFTPIGFYQSVDPYGEYAVTALLKSTAFAP